MEVPESLVGWQRLEARLKGVGVPRSAVAALASRCTLVRYPKGAVLFRQGGSGDLIFVLLSGAAKVYCPVQGAASILMEVAAPGDLLGYADFLDSAGARRQIFEVHALAPCSVALFTRSHIAEVLNALELNVLVHLLERAGSLWADIIRRHVRLLGMSLRERLQAIFDELGAKFGVEDARGVLIPLEIGQEDLAQMIGSSRPMVSRLLAEMTQQHSIARQGKNYIIPRTPVVPHRVHAQLLRRNIERIIESR